MSKYVDSKIEKLCISFSEQRDDIPLQTPSGNVVGIEKKNLKLRNSTTTEL